jgi:hypothetical protein
MDPVGSSRRLAVLAGHLGTSSSSSGQGLVRQETASTAVRSLPKFDPYIMETYLDDLREMKRQVYDLFKFKPELLPGPELSKGGCPAACASASTIVRCGQDHQVTTDMSATAQSTAPVHQAAPSISASALFCMHTLTSSACPIPAEEHRALVRTNLRALLQEGINPLSFFDRDYKKVRQGPVFLQSCSPAASQVRHPSSCSSAAA